VSAKTRIRRFTPVQRLFHVLLILSFLTQGATGFARLYIETSWGSFLANIFGGYRGAGAVHKVVGILMICAFAAHVLYLMTRINWRRFPKDLLGPNSLLPRPQDFLDFIRHVGWFLGLARPPRFDRWGYWEKFDYWAVFWGIPVLAVTGLLLTFPVLTGRYLPGWVLIPALWVHRIEALLAMAHVFIIHFFIGHLRRHNFPMDRAMFEGSVDLAAMKEEKPAWIERENSSGKLQDLLVSQASFGRRMIYYIFGYAVMAIGAFLLIGGIVNSTSITW